MNDFKYLFEFEKAVAKFFSAPYAVATDCCTHALELCLYLKKYDKIVCPFNTYISVPFMLEKIKRKYVFKDIKWSGYYYLTNDVVDAATFWKRGGYIKNTKMCLSFHLKKHINIGKGGMILLDNKHDYIKLQKMRYDGRSIYDGILYKDDNIRELGYHYYMTPETAKHGLEIFKVKKHMQPKDVTYLDYDNLMQFDFFKKEKGPRKRPLF